MKKGRTVLLRRSTRFVGGNTGGPSERSKSQRAILNISKKSGDDDGGNCCNESTYKLKWNLQSQQLLKELANIYGQDEHCDGPREKDGTDVTLFNSEGGGCISAHRIVLMMCSPYFRKLFAEVSKSRRNGNDNAVVILGNVSTAAQLHNLVRFIYTGEVDVCSEIELDEFTKIAQQFGLEGVSTSSTSSAPTVKVTAQKRNKSTPNKGEVEGTICKNEPSDDVYINDDEGGGGDDTNFAMEEGGDDEASNFSDDFRNNLISSDDNEKDDDLVKDPDVSFGGGGGSGRSKNVKKKFSKRSSSQGEANEDVRLDHRTGKFRNWTRIDVPSEEELTKGWRTKGHIRGVSYTIRKFYCRYGGKKCPAEIKIKTLNDGTQLCLRNACEHEYHQGLNYHSGLTQDQKQFVIDCLQAGVTQPANILLKFDLNTSGIPKPQVLKLKSMLQQFKKQCPEYWKKKEPSKWPKRIRKKPKTVEPPKKRGRPSATLSAGTSSILTSDSQRPPPAPTNAATTSSSSSPPAPVSSSSLANFPAHPNHFMGQTSFPWNPNTPSIVTVIPPPQLYPFDNNNFR